METGREEEVTVDLALGQEERVRWTRKVSQEIHCNRDAEGVACRDDLRNHWMVSSRIPRIVRSTQLLEDRELVFLWKPDASAEKVFEAIELLASRP